MEVNSEGKDSDSNLTFIYKSSESSSDEEEFDILKNLSSSHSEYFDALSNFR